MRKLSAPVHLGLEYADIRQVAVALVIVQPVADDECVRHLKAGVVRVYIRLAARGLSNADLEPGKYPYLESSHYAAGYSKGRPLCAPVLERAAKKKEQGKKPLFPKFKTSKKK